MPKFLTESPLKGSIILMILYYLALINAAFLARILFSGLPYYIFALINFSIVFSFLAILWLCIVPYGFKFPNDPVVYKEYLETIRLDKSSFKPFRNTIFAFITLIGIIFLIILAVSFVMGLNFFDPYVLSSLPTSSDPKWLIFLFALVPAIWEEIAFRGVILSIYEKNHPEEENLIIFINGILFGVFHLGNLLLGAILLRTLIQVIFAFLIGMFFSQ
jgi:membrane protease YdiL (CAAX protease family)